MAPSPSMQPQIMKICFITFKFIMKLLKFWAQACVVWCNYCNLAPMAYYQTMIISSECSVPNAVRSRSWTGSMPMGLKLQYFHWLYGLWYLIDWSWQVKWSFLCTRPWQKWFSVLSFLCPSKLKISISAWPFPARSGGKRFQYSENVF